MTNALQTTEEATKVITALSRWINSQHVNNEVIVLAMTAVLARILGSHCGTPQHLISLMDEVKSHLAEQCIDAYAQHHSDRRVS